MSACATTPPLCPDKDACREDPMCALVTDDVEGPTCLSQRGCESVARWPIGPCPKNLPAAALEQFLANPAAHVPPVTLTGILVAREPLYDRLYREPPRGVCSGTSRGLLALVPAAGADANPPPGKHRRDLGSSYDRGRGVAVIPSALDRGPFLCHGDGSALCCEVPLDGRPVAVTFDRARTRPRDWVTRLSDYDDLTFSAMCSLGS